VGGCQAGRRWEVSSYKAGGFRQYRNSYIFKFEVNYLNFGATYLSFGAIHLSFGAIYLSFGAIYLKLEPFRRVRGGNGWVLKPRCLMAFFAQVLKPRVVMAFFAEVLKPRVLPPKVGLIALWPSTNG